MAAQEVFERMPTQFLPEKSGQTRIAVQCELSGKGGRQWWVRIGEGRCTVGTGPVEKPDLTFIASADDMVKIRLGQLERVAAVTSGHLRIKGQRSRAFKLASMFRREP
jgi:putative sterol carrier protein